VDSARPLIVSQVYSAELAAAVKLALGRIYPEDHATTIVAGAGVSGASSIGTVPLHQLDRVTVDHLTSVYVAPLLPLDAARGAETLTRLVARLRAPGGCPWDREQTHESLRNAIIEEAYETVDAIDGQDAFGLAEELGDLLLLVTMHSQLAEEDGTFRIEDVYDHVNRKIVRRHPHVFADVSAETPDAVISTWESVKAAERAGKLHAIPATRYELLPRSMPALRKAIDLLAPRTTLHAADDPATGKTLLDAIRDLIAAGIDPERALESALRVESATVNNNGQVESAAKTSAATKEGLP
jgi:tetrapyrrole methylase family protein/MazG family protein